MDDAEVAAKPLSGAIFMLGVAVAGMPKLKFKQTQ